MRENEITQEITRIALSAQDLSAALGGIQALLASSWGGALLVVREPSPHSRSAFPAAVGEFLESRDFPFRGLYVAPIETGAAGAGKLIACIGTWGGPEESLRRIVDFAGEQLSVLARRLPARAIHYAEAA